MDVIDSPIKKADCKIEFCQALRSLSQKRPQDVALLHSQMSEVKKKFVMEVLQSQSVKITGENRTETRRIVKVARRTGPQAQQNKAEVKIPERKWNLNID